MKDDLIKLVAAWLAWGVVVVERALVIMFLAAVIHEQFDVWTPMGFWAAVAWGAGLTVVRGVFKKTEES